MMGFVQKKGTWEGIRCTSSSVKKYLEKVEGISIQDKDEHPFYLVDPCFGSQ